MKKDLLLVLSIYEGRAWKPCKGHGALIIAKLGANTSSTELTPLTSSPKFNSEINWEVEKQTIRSYKLRKLPIRIECFSINEENKRNLLGYVILPLDGAVENVETDAKWHKLLGGPSTAHKYPPCILLKLSLQNMTLDKRNHINDGQIATTNSKLAYENNPHYTNGGNFPGNVSVTKAPPPPSLNPPTHNGQVEHNLFAYQREQNTNSLLLEAGNGLGAVGAATASMDPSSLAKGAVVAIAADLSEEEEEDYLSDEDMEGDLYEDLDYLNRNAIPVNEKEEKMNVEISPMPCDSKSKEPLVVNRKINSPQLELEQSNLLNSRASVREHLRRLSKENIDASLFNESVSQDNSEGCFRKRFLESLNTAASSPVAHNNKIRKIDLLSSEETVPKQNQIPMTHTDDNLHSRTHYNETPSPPLLSPLCRSNSGQSSQVNTERREKLTAYLNKEGGHFQIGPPGLPNEESFKYSVTVYDAHNLSQVVPEDILSSLTHGFQFRFSIMGTPVYTATFFELDKPNFLAEVATASVRATAENMSEFFMQHSFLPVYLLSGETILATCNIDLFKLKDIKGSEMTLRGSHKLCAIHPLRVSQCRGEDSTAAAASVCIQLTKCNDSVNISPNNAPDNQITEEPEVVLSDSSSDSSIDTDLDERANCIAKFLKRKTVRRNHSSTSRPRRNKTTKILKLQLQGELQKYKKKLLHEAAAEVEEWKEEQLKLQLKEWSVKEESLQKHLAAEWSFKIKIVEGELESKLRECDLLQDRMTTALKDLNLRDDKIKEREIKVNDMESQLHQEKLKLQFPANKSHAEPKIDASSAFSKQLELEKDRREYLEKQVAKLQEGLRNAEERFNDQTREILQLRKRLLENDETASVQREMDLLRDRLSSATERKQYYKTQWIHVMNDLHKLHSVHKKAAHDVLSEVRSRSPEAAAIDGLHTEKLDCHIKKLVNERKTLISSRVYPSNHSIIKDIDKKIQSLLNK